MRELGTVNGYKISVSVGDPFIDERGRHIKFLVEKGNKESAVRIGMAHRVKTIWNLQQNDKAKALLEHLGFLKITSMILDGVSKNEFIFDYGTISETSEDTIKKLEDKILKKEENKTTVGFIKDR